MSESSQRVPATARRLKGIAEIRGFFRTNTAPVYFFGPPHSTCSAWTAGSAISVRRLLRRLGRGPPPSVHPEAREAVRKVQVQ